MNKLYIVVTNDIPLAHQGVQGGHAVAQWLLENPNQTWNNHTLVYLQSNNLKKLMHKLNYKNIKYSKFIEPYWSNKITAVALQTEDKILSKLKLMGA